MSRNQLSWSFLPSCPLTLPVGLHNSPRHLSAFPEAVAVCTWAHQGCATARDLTDLFHSHKRCGLDLLLLDCCCCATVLSGLQIPNFLPRIICEEFNVNLFLHQCFPLIGRGFSSLPHSVRKQLGCLCCRCLVQENRLRLHHIKVCCRAEISFLHESFP